MELLKEVIIRIYHTTQLRNDVDYRIQGFVQTPFLNVVQIRPHSVSASTLTNKKLADDIKMVAGLAKSEVVAIDVHRGFVCIEIPRPAAERGQIVYTLADIPRGRALRVPLGLDTLGMPTHHDFSKQMQTNLAFLGAPGSGKSISMRGCIVSLAKNNTPDRVRFLMLEVAKDGLDLRLFGSLPHLIHPVVTNPDEAVQALGWALAQIRSGKLPFHLFICIDEVAALIQQRPEVIEILKSLVAEGRAMNAVNLLSTQLVDEDTLGKEGQAIFRQIHNRILGKVAGKQLSYLMSGKGQLKAEALTGEGDLLLSSNHDTTRFAGVFATRQDIESLPRVETVNRLPIEDFTNSNALAQEAKALLSPPAQTGQFEEQPIPSGIIAEGLISLQRQVCDLEYRDSMRGMQYYVLPARQIKNRRNPTIFKERDQPRIVELYRELYKRGVRLCRK